MDGVGQVVQQWAWHPDPDCHWLTIPARRPELGLCRSRAAMALRPACSPAPTKFTGGTNGSPSRALLQPRPRPAGPAVQAGGWADSSLVQYMQRVAASGIPDERHAGQVLAAGAGPNTVTPRRAETFLYGTTMAK